MVDGERLALLDGQGVANLVWAYAKLGRSDAALFGAVAARVATRDLLCGWGLGAADFCHISTVPLHQMAVAWLIFNTPQIINSPKLHPSLLRTDFDPSDIPPS